MITKVNLSKIEKKYGHEIAKAAENGIVNSKTLRRLNNYSKQLQSELLPYQNHLNLDDAPNAIVRLKQFLCNNDLFKDGESLIKNVQIKCKEKLLNWEDKLIVMTLKKGDKTFKEELDIGSKETRIYYNFGSKQFTEQLQTMFDKLKNK